MKLGVVVAVALLCGACGEPVATRSPKPQPSADPLPVSDDDLCTVHCERAETCGVFRDACERDCPARGRPIRKMRHDFVGRMMLCLDGAACNGLKEGTAWKGCHTSVLKTLPVSDVLRKFCFASSRKAAQCGRGDEADQIACLTQFRFNSDAALRDGMRCAEKACADVPACLASALTR